MAKDKHSVESAALCIDTGIFSLEDYRLDRGLIAQLAQFKGAAAVQVVIPEVVDREMRRALAARSRKAREALQRALRGAQDDLLVPEDAINKARKACLSPDTDEEIAQRRLLEFYERCGAVIVPSDLATSRAVLDRGAPFLGDQTFADAFALLSLERWAEENRYQVMVVSVDDRWEMFCHGSKYLAHERDLGSALAQFQSRDAFARQLQNLNTALCDDESDIQLALAGELMERVETAEVEVTAESPFYWDAVEARAEYRGHEFLRVGPELVDVDLVRMAEQGMTVRLIAKIACQVQATFALSMLDPITHESVNLGSRTARVEERFHSDVLVTFGEGLSIEDVELVEDVPLIDFGQIEDTAVPDDVDDDDGTRVEE